MRIFMGATPQWMRCTGSLEGCLKSVGRVAHLRLVTRRPDDRDDVEAGGRLGEAVAGQVELGALGDLVLLVLVDLLFGSWVVVETGFDLDEDQRLAVAGDDVDFAELAAVVADENLVALALEVTGRGVLAAIAEG